jgi:hypothetical protein
MKKRQYRSNQGRSPEKETDSMKLILLTAFAAAVCSLVSVLIQWVW